MVVHAVTPVLVPVHLWPSAGTSKSSWDSCQVHPLSTGSKDLVELVIIFSTNTSQGLLSSKTSFGVKKTKVTFKSPWGHPLPHFIDATSSVGPPPVSPILLSSGKFSLSQTLTPCFWCWISPMGRVGEGHSYLASGMWGLRGWSDLIRAFLRPAPALCPAAILSELLQRENRVLHFWTLKKRRLDQCQQYVVFERSAKQVCSALSLELSQTRTVQRPRWPRLGTVPKRVITPNRIEMGDGGKKKNPCTNHQFSFHQALYSEFGDRSWEEMLGADCCNSWIIVDLV